MIYEIDESCVAVLKTNELNSVAFFEQLALDRRKCRNIIVAKKDVLFELSNMKCFSDFSRTMYKILGNRMSEGKLILKSAKKYCRIVASNCGKSLLMENGQEIILLNIMDGVQNDFTNSSLMLTENEDDIEFYKYIGLYYIKNRKIGKVKINFEGRNGGGSTISNVLKRIIEEKNRMCLCIVDSDRQYEGASMGGTMRHIVDVTQNTIQDFFEVLLLEVHEIENLIPLSFLDRIVDENNLDRQGLSFLKYLVTLDDSNQSPVFYYDLKKGILKNSFILSKEASEEQKKKYREKELYRKYWKGYIEGYGIKIDDSCKSKMVSGVCEKVLKYSLQYFEEMMEAEKFAMLEIEPYLKNVWEEIGEKVYCWGCVGGRIAI